MCEEEGGWDGIPCGSMALGLWDFEGGIIPIWLHRLYRYGAEGRWI